MKEFFSVVKSDEFLSFMRRLGSAVLYVISVVLGIVLVVLITLKALEMSGVLPPFPTPLL